MCQKGYQGLIKQDFFVLQHLKRAVQSSLIFDRGEKKKLMKVMNVHMKITSCTLNKPEKKKNSFFCL